MYTPEGNGIVEWCPCTIKRIAARTLGSCQEAVSWYNTMPRDVVTTQTVPANRIYRYKQRVKEIDQVPKSLQSTKELYEIGNLV